MPRIVPLRLEKTNETILVEVDDELPALPPPSVEALPGLTRAASVPGKMAEGAAASSVNSFDAALRKVKPAIEQVVEQLRTLSPDGFSVEFGLTLAGDVNLFYIAQGGMAANFKVTLHWRPSPGYATS